jgi:hypothetical protein
MGLPSRLARAWSPGARLLFLRLCSAAWLAASVWVWFRCTRLPLSADMRRFVVGGGLVALFLPSLFYVHGRIGSDSPVAFLVSAVLYVMLSLRFRPRRRRRDLVLLGVLLGLGLVVKGFFVLIAPGAVAYYVWLCWATRSRAPARAALDVVLVLAIALALGGWWFGLNIHRYGRPIDSVDMRWHRTFVPPSGSQQPLGEVARHVVRAAAGTCTSFMWSSTWSMMRRPAYHYALCAPFVLVAAYGLWRAFREKRLAPAFWAAPVCIAGAMGLGLLNHMYRIVWLVGCGSGAQGYYLFAVWPAVTVFFAPCFLEKRSRFARAAVGAAFVLLLVFEFWGHWIMLQTYAGVLVKAGAVRTGVGAVWPTPANVGLVLGRVNELALGTWAVVLLAASAVLRLVLLRLSLRGPGAARPGSARP